MGTGLNVARCGVSLEGGARSCEGGDGQHTGAGLQGPGPLAAGGCTAISGGRLLGRHRRRHPDGFRRREARILQAHSKVTHQMVTTRCSSAISKCCTITHLSAGVNSLM